ncbi:MAG: alkylmercury lyase [Actinomycetota bacterium]|nr:alkylmercury lyase [Actinomycetota bacterium]
MTPDRRVDLWFDTDCPLAASVRRLVAACIAEARPGWVLHEHRDAGVVSPTVLVAGEPVAGVELVRARGCRLRVPTREEVLAMLRTAEAAS